MSSPTVNDTWFTRCNIPFPDSATAKLVSDSWVFNLKAALLGQIVNSGTFSGSGGVQPTSSFWVVKGSSNGVTFSYGDGVDKLGTQFTGTNYVHAASGTAHSWIQLMSPVALGPVYMTIDLCSATTANMGIVFSRTAPFNTGSLIGRPVSLFDWMAGTNTVAANTSIATISDATTAANHSGHIVMNQSGAFHWASSRNTTGIFNCYLNCLNAVDTEVQDLHPTWTGFHSVATTRGAPQYATLVGVVNTTGRTHTSGALNTVGGLNLWTFGATAHAGATTSDSITSQFRVFPVYIQTLVAAANAWRGRLQDFYVIGAAAVGSSYPTAANPTMHVVGDMLVPFSVVPIL
jgi:hypothetical protein